MLVEKICCPICWAVLTQNDQIVNTMCGHAFHSACLYQWFEKSYTCPQCRAKISPGLIKKLYFTWTGDSETNTCDDNCPKQKKIDALKFKLLQNKKNIDCFVFENRSLKNNNSWLKNDNSWLKNNNSRLKQEVQRRESELKEKISVIDNLKEVLQSYKRKCEKTKKMKILHENRKTEKDKEIYSLGFNMAFYVLLIFTWIDYGSIDFLKL